MNLLAYVIRLNNIQYANEYRTSSKQLSRVFRSVNLTKFINSSFSREKILLPNTTQCGKTSNSMPWNSFSLCEGGNYKNLLLRIFGIFVKVTVLIKHSVEKNSVEITEILSCTFLAKLS